MSIGIFGIFIIILSITFLVKQEYLLLAAVFFAPFYECGVFTFSNFYLQPGHYFLLLYMVCFILKSLQNRVMKLSKPNLFLLSFVIVAVLSVFIAILFEIDELVYGIGNGIQLEHSIVDAQNFTQLLYLLFAFVLYCLFSQYCKKSEKNWNKGVKIVTLSGLAVLLIGIYQLVANAFGLPFNEIFRTNQHIMWQQLSRVQSTMGEASYLGQFCTWFFVIAVTGFNWWNKSVIKFASIVLVGYIGILTRSSTFLIGAVAVIVAYGFFQKPTFLNWIKYLFAIIVALVSFIFLYQNNPYLQILIVNTINKFNLQTISGVQRAEVFTYMSHIGMNHLLTGIGYGGGRSTDLYSHIFATTGIFGVLTFFGFLISSFWKLLKFKDRAGVLMCLLLIIGIFATGIGVPEINYLSIWSLFSIIDTKCYLERVKTTDIVNANREATISIDENVLSSKHYAAPSVGFAVSTRCFFCSDRRKKIVRTHCPVIEMPPPASK